MTFTVLLLSKVLKSLLMIIFQHKGRNVSSCGLPRVGLIVQDSSCTFASTFLFSKMNLYQFVMHSEMPMASMAFSAESKLIRSKALAALKN